MKRLERQRRERGDSEDQRFARVALEELRGVWKTEEQARTARLGQAARLMRLVAETREMLALWTYYRLASLEAMDSGHMGVA